ncbi:MAG: hypothetical protein ABI233_00150 [Chthoniobacterales bacterium]
MRGKSAAGNVFTAIDNKSQEPISDAFASSTDGAVVSVGGNQLHASYIGGDGIDLTLTWSGREELRAFR